MRCPPPHELALLLCNCIDSFLDLQNASVGIFFSKGRKDLVELHFFLD